MERAKFDHLITTYGKENLKLIRLDNDKSIEIIDYDSQVDLTNEVLYGFSVEGEVNHRCTLVTSSFEFIQTLDFEFSKKRGNMAVLDSKLNSTTRDYLINDRALSELQSV